MRFYTWQDRFVLKIDSVLHAVIPSQTYIARSSPASDLPPVSLTPAEKAQAAALMRVNHSGEVCAQALYQGQALTARSYEVQRVLRQSAQEETDHLLWCQERIQQLGGHTSYLNPVWYLGSFLIGIAAGLAGDAYSLGFLAETEDQVTRHLTRHLDQLPKSDRLSRCVVEQMRVDEMAHQRIAEQMGAISLPQSIQSLMALCSRIMTSVAYVL